MLRTTKNNNLIINNALEFGEELTTEANGKGRKFVSRFIEAGLAHYEQFGDVLITKETLDKFIQTMVGCPVIIKHKDITDDNADKERVGVVSKVWFDETDGWFYCEGIIWNKQAIDLVKNQGWSVSCTYDFESDFKKGTYHGKDYDMEFTNGTFLHLALVPNPRYERATIVMNSKDGHWVTIKHRPVFIKDKNIAEDIKNIKSLAQLKAHLQAYKMAHNSDKAIIDEIDRIQQDIKEDVAKEIEVAKKEYNDLENSPKVQNLKKQIEKYVGKNVTFERIDPKGYEWSIGASNGEGIDSIMATKLVDSINARSTFLVAEKYGFHSNLKKCYIKVKVEGKKMIENAKDWDGNEGEWITIKGNHLFIKKGQSKDEAVKEFIDKQEDKKTETTKEEKKDDKKETKSSPEVEKDYNYKKNKIDENKIIWSADSRKSAMQFYEVIDDELGEEAWDDLMSEAMESRIGSKSEDEDSFKEKWEYILGKDAYRKFKNMYTAGHFEPAENSLNNIIKNSLDVFCEVLAEALTEE